LIVSVLPPRSWRRRLTHILLNTAATVSIAVGRDYWDLGLCPPSGIAKNTKEHNVSDILRLALSSGPSSVDVSHPSLEDGNRSGFRNVVFFSAVWDTGRWIKSRNPVIRSGISVVTI
jgi:hypothetical protein